MDTLDALDNNVSTKLLESENEDVFDLSRDDDPEPGVQAPLLTSAKKPNLDENVDKYAETAGVSASIFNLVNTIVGGGVLALPFGYKRCGLFLGLLLTVFVALLSAYSAHLLVQSRVMAQMMGVSRKASYYTVVSVAFGLRVAKAVEACIVVSMMGAQIGYIAIVGETLSQTLEGALGHTSWYIDAWFIQLTILTLVMFPLSLLPTVGALKYSSALALSGILFLVVCILVKSVSVRATRSLGAELTQNFGRTIDDEEERFLELFSWSRGVFAAIPILTFAFSMHVQMFPIWAELRSPTPRRIKGIVFSGIATCCVVYMLVGAFGYLTFFDLTSQNVLTNYEEDVVIELGKVAYCLIICVSYPLMMFPARLSIDELLRHITGRRLDEGSFWRRFTIVLLVSWLNYFAAVALADIQIIFGLTGATVGVLLIYIIPAACAMRLAFMTRRNSNDNWKENLANWLDFWEVPKMLLLLIGMAFGVIGVVVLLE